MTQAPVWPPPHWVAYLQQYAQQHSWPHLPRRRHRRWPLEWFLFVSVCYLYCIDFYGHIQKLVCTICGVVVVVDERYPTLFGFALDVTMYIAYNADCAI